MLSVVLVVNPLLDESSTSAWAQLGAKTATRRARDKRKHVPHIRSIVCESSWACFSLPREFFKSTSEVGFHGAPAFDTCTILLVKRKDPAAKPSGGQRPKLVAASDEL